MANFAGFVGPAYKMASLPIDSQRCINWYTEKQQNNNSASLYVLQPTPGYLTLTTVTDTSLPLGSYTRGIYRTTRGLGVKPDVNGSVIMVVGPNVYELKQDNSYTLLGKITNRTSQVSMVDDGFGLIIVDGVGMYRLDLTTRAFAKVSFDLTEPTSVAFMGGYTIVIGQQKNIPQNTFFWSGLYDNASWGALDYASAESSADAITGMVTTGGYLWLFGPSSYEVWSPTGDKDLPYQRAYASTGTVGLTANFSLNTVQNKVLMIGSNAQGSAIAFASQGTEMIRISTLALEAEWSGVNITDASSWTYSQEGHVFWVINFDLLDKTYVYDLSEEAWHERATRNPVTDVLHRWAPNYCVQRGGQILVGDRYSTKLFELSHSYTLEDGNNVLRVRTTAHTRTELKLFQLNKVTFDMDTGNGITAEDPARYSQAPTCMYRYSWDSARTWSSEIRQQFGAMGQYKTMMEFRRHGRGRVYTVDFKISDPCKTAILGAWIDVEVAGQR